jgi:hypothetical protein
VLLHARRTAAQRPHGDLDVRPLVGGVLAGVRERVVDALLQAQGVEERVLWGAGVHPQCHGHAGHGQQDVHRANDGGSQAIHAGAHLEAAGAQALQIHEAAGAMGARGE